jgi:hypothetical protein
MIEGGGAWRRTITVMVRHVCRADEIQAEPEVCEMTLSGTIDESDKFSDTAYALASEVIDTLEKQHEVTVTEDIYREEMEKEEAGANSTGEIRQD